MRLGQNKFKMIPEEIENLKKLYSLELFENDLTQIPYWIKNMTYLSKLNLIGNQELGDKAKCYYKDPQAFYNPKGSKIADLFDQKPN